MTFKIEKKVGSKSGHDYDSVTTFYDSKGSVEAEYFYYKGRLNYLISSGFVGGSLSEMRKSKAHKAKKPFFSLTQGWLDVEQIKEVY